MMFKQSRQEVVEICLTLADSGYLAGTGGNVALRPDPRHFLVTPSGIDYYTMSAQDICVLRLADKQQVDGEKSPSVEAGLHANVLTARPDCTASIHTHQPVASAYSLLDIALGVEGQESITTLGENIPCVPYAPSGTGWLAKRVGQVFNETTHACFIRNHGVVCVGQDAHQAMQRVVTLEAVCAAYFRASTAGSSTVSAATAALIEQTLSAFLKT